MVAKGKFMTQSLNCVCVYNLYHIKSLAFTLSFPLAFKDAATERRVQFSRKLKHPEYSDIPKPWGGLAIGDTGGIPGGLTGLGWSKIPAHSNRHPALAPDFAGTDYNLCFAEHV